jgi:hypothetical protein
MTKHSLGATTADLRRHAHYSSSQSHARSNENNHHRPMNGLTAPPLPTSVDPSEAHHGQSGVDTKSGSMDTTSGSSQQHATATNPEAMNAGATEQTPPTLSSSSSSSQPASTNNTSPPDLSLPPKPPAITFSQPPRSTHDDEPRFEGPLLLCQKKYEPSKPHPTQDLFALYGLTPLAASVARRDLTTGAKINPMRKTYAGQIKGFQLAGKNKAFPHAEGGVGMSLSEMIMWPEPEWHNQRLSGRDITKGFSSAIQDKLEKAFKLEPGPVPKNDEWESILGLEKVKPAPAPKSESKNAAALGKPARSGVPVNGARTPQHDAQAEVNRPKRANKRRRYDDDSYEGYGAGFDDGDVVDDGGYSSGDGSRRSGNGKKRRKVGSQT